MPGLLYRLEAEAAVAALAVMSEEWQADPAPVRTRPDREAVPADARILLGRYGSAAQYWTNVTAAASDPAPDFVAAGLQGTCSNIFLTSAHLNGLDLFHDLGLIAVSGDEGPYEREVTVDVLGGEPGPAQPVVPFGQHAHLAEAHVLLGRWIARRTAAPGGGTRSAKSSWADQVLIVYSAKDHQLP
ncbi:hypothetical protein [Streptomyces sp. C36]|uniref:hypothetical protein n=1 Tax=Streptomyces sp. C36 TaxID=3237122 RepID=UPI0034C6C847